MKQVYYSEALKIKYDDTSVSVNDRIVLDEERNNEPFEAYAKTKMRQAYCEIISRQYENIVVLTGAGTSVNVGIGKNKGKPIKELWSIIVDKIGFSALEAFAKSINFSSINQEYTDIEDFLSQAKLSEAYYHHKTTKDMIDSIEMVIRNSCNLDLPENAPHINFLRRITARKLKYSRVKIFTLNYDLLFEQAASRGGYIVIDGFSFNIPRVFNGTNFDYDIVTRSTNRAISEENFSPRVFHLYKIHGSLDWGCNRDSGDEIYTKSNHPKDPVMIYPSKSKFEASYEQPYFEMISRFQQELRTKNILLLVIGFSFSDKHIKAMIMEALNVNPSITMAVICPDVKDDNKYLELKSKTDTMKNVILISENFEDFSKNFPYSDVYDYTNGGITSS